MPIWVNDFFNAYNIDVIDEDGAHYSIIKDIEKADFSTNTKFKYILLIKRKAENGCKS